MGNEETWLWYVGFQAMAESHDPRSAWGAKGADRVERPALPRVEVVLKDGQKGALRVVLESDVADVCRLNGQLGYVSDAGLVLARIQSVGKTISELVLVLEVQNQVVGWIQVSDRETIEGGKRVEIVGLVTDQETRRLGIGSILVRAALAAAKAKGRERVVVRTNITRSEARFFYTALGFRRSKTQDVYEFGLE